MLLADRICGAQVHEPPPPAAAIEASKKEGEVVHEPPRSICRRPRFCKKTSCRFFLKHLSKTPVGGKCCCCAGDLWNRLVGACRRMRCTLVIHLFPPAALLLPAVTRLGRPLAPQAHHRGLSNATGARGGASGREALACKGKARGAGASCSPPWRTPGAEAPSPGLTPEPRAQA